MKFLKLFILVSFVFLSSLFVNNIFAEEEEVLEVQENKNEEDVTVVDFDFNAPGKMLQVSDISILRPKIISQDNGLIKLSFSIINGDNILSGIKYGLSLGEKLENGINIIDNKVYDESLTLYQKESILKEIEYQIPSGVFGDFVLYINIRNNNGLPLGTSFAGNINVDLKENSFAVLHKDCYLSVSSLEDKIFSLNQGVDIKEDEDIILNCKIENFSSNIKTITPEYETHVRNIYGEIVSHSGGDLTSIKLDSLEKKDISLVLPKAQYPQAYDVRISFSDGENYSNSVVAHYVLAGESGTLQKISLDKDYYNNGDVANVSFLWAPRADSFPGSRNGPIPSNYSNFAYIEIKNDKGFSCSELIEKELFTNYATPYISIPVPVISECVNPTVSIILKNSNGEVLDQEEFFVETQSIKKLPNLYYILIIAVLFIGGFVFFLLRKRKENRNLIKPTLLILFTVGVMFGFSVNEARAGSFVFGDNTGYSATVPYNLDYGYSYNGGDEISISFGPVEFNACANAVTSFSLSASSASVFNYSHSAGDPVYSLYNTVYLTAQTESGSYRIPVTGTYTTTFDDGTTVSNTSTGYIDYEVNGDGECGTTHYDCNEGTPSSKSAGLDAWTWQCLGYGNGSSDSCSEGRELVNGDCGEGSYYRCDSGVARNHSDNEINWTWDCMGIGGGTDDLGCSFNKTIPVCGDDLFTCISGDVQNQMNPWNPLYPVTWECDTFGSDPVSCSINITKPVCGDEINTCEIGDVNGISETNDYYRWNCDCDNTEDCNYPYSSWCSIEKPINAVCSPNTINGCDVGEYDWNDNNPDDFSWVCLGDQGGSDAQCSIDPNNDMYGELNVSSCSIPINDSSCYIHYSWDVYNPETEGGSTVDRDDIPSTINSGDSGTGAFLTSPRSGNIILSNNNKILSTKWFSAGCVAGSSWNSSEQKCLAKIDGGWSDWTECTKECGGGTKTRYCNNPSPENGGAKCRKLDGYYTSLNETIVCNSQPCEIPFSVSIDGPNIFNVGTDQLFKIKINSPDEEKVNYNIDWDGDGYSASSEIDERYPSNSSGVSANAIVERIHKWLTPGVHKFKVQAIKYTNATIKTPWVEKTVNVKGSDVVIGATPKFLMSNDDARVTWSATNVDYCTGNFPINVETKEPVCFNNYLGVSFDGNKGLSVPKVCTGYNITGSYIDIKPEKDFIYSISCPNIDKTLTVSDSVFVKKGNPRSEVDATLKATPDFINSGEISYLYWTTMYINKDENTCKIVDDKGVVIAGSDEFSSDLLSNENYVNTNTWGEAYAGSVPVSPSRLTNYKLVCSIGPGPDATIFVDSVPPECRNNCGTIGCPECPPPPPVWCINNEFNPEFGEEGVDCGGLCPECSTKKPPIFIET